MVKIEPLLVLDDNYSYLIVEGEHAIVIDPSVSQPVINALERKGLKLAGILNTHHHWDHVGGNKELVAYCKAAGYAVDVYGYREDSARIPHFSKGLADGECFSLAGIDIQAIHTPGHTLGSIVYSIENYLFTGDTLFAVGCGRLFEGDAKMLYDSIHRKILAFDNDTILYFGHDYLAKNLEFALSIDKGHRKNLSRQQKPGFYSTLGIERQTNPFLRVAEAEYCEMIRCEHFKRDQFLSSVHAFAWLRTQRNTF